MKPIALAVLFLTSCIFSCRKEKPAEPTGSVSSLQGPFYVPVDDSLMNRFGYQSGSYWIYTDSVTGKDVKLAVSDVSTRQIKRYSNIFCQTVIGLVRNDTASRTLNLPSKLFLVEQSMAIGYTADSTQDIWIKPPWPNKLAQYNVAGKNYPAVTAVKSGSGDEFFVSDSVGIVKMTIRDVSGNHVWLLNSCNIAR